MVLNSAQTVKPYSWVDPKQCLDYSISLNLTVSFSVQTIFTYILDQMKEAHVFLLFFVSFKTIIQYIDNQFERYLHDESGLNRRHIVDNRVHCCFYFISPFGHG